MTPVDEERLSALLRSAAPASAGVTFDDVARAVRTRRVVRWSAVTAVVAAVAVTAVSVTALGGPARRTAGPSPATSAAPVDLDRLARHVPCSAARSPVSPDRLAGFVAVTAVSCDRTTRRFRGDGEWLVAVRGVATAGVTDLQRAYQLPSERLWHGPCTTELVVVPPLVLVDASGRTIAPSPPRDRCGKPLPAFLRAERAVRWREVSVRRIRQLVTPPAETAGCPMQWKNENAVYPQDTLRGSPGGSPFPSPPARLHACLYRTSGSAWDVGDFRRGLTLGPSATSGLLRAVDGPPPTGACRTQRDFAVVSAGGNGPWLDIELGGCWRVTRSYPRTSTGTADASTVRQLLLHRR